ncbi:MAG: aminoacyl--tRNA ligase-related protein [Patescibacteria group bacterium]|nr:aminoacyl--tRNA ligase-related protein [Patescibacteria group bacterium]
MRYSNYFLKTQRSAPASAVAQSHKLLYRAGFIKQVAAGRYALLPIGFRTNQKIMDIIADEMQRIGALRMELPIMQPIEVWRITNRDEAFGDLMIVADDHYGRTFVMNATGEALMTEVVGSTRPSYKDLPINVYQFLPKFRDELRPRGGLIRVREFLMKDGYNFERTEKDFMKTYQDYWNAYDKIFTKLGLETIVVEADSGALGGDYSHEFMVITPENVQNLDIYLDKDENLLPIEDVDASKDQKLFKKILKIYARTSEKTLKNMIYYVDDKEYVCITIRGDYRIDFTKLRRLLNYKQIRPGTKDEISELGSYIGYVSAIGLNPKVRVLVDETVKFNKNYWDGAHKEKLFRKNVNLERDFEHRETVDIHEDKVFSAGGDKIVMCDRCDYKANVEKAEFVREEVNMDQELKEFKIVDQPEWVCTMDENVEHYKKPKSHFLKNVVYKDKNGRLIIAVVRGDIEANDIKISNLLKCGPLELADDEDLASIGTKRGWVHSWGHDKDNKNVIYVGDIALEKSHNLIGGEKEKTTDSFNVNYGRDFKCSKLGDIASAYDGAKCKHCKDGYLKEKKGVEVGHIFKYDHYYSIPHKATFVDKDGKEKHMWMGAYGIGVGRAMASVVEMHHDAQGIIWPKSVAPFLIHIVSIGNSDNVMSQSRKVYKKFVDQEWEVLWDDRADSSAGVKLTDADLIGVPIRVVVSEKTLKDQRVEVKLRSEKAIKLVGLDGNELISYIKDLWAKLDQ